MRISSIVVIAALILTGSAIAQSLTGCSTTSGVNAEALSWLTSGGVQVATTTVYKNDTLCNNLFKTPGSCCEITTLQKKISDINNKMAEKWKSYIGTLGKFKNVIMSGVKKLQSSVNPSAIAGRIAQLNAVGASTKLGDVLPLIPTDEASLKILSDSISSFDADLNTYKTEGKMCFEALRNARSNIFCAICSANNADFAKPQSKYEFVYKIDKDSCSALVKSCFFTWRFNLNVLTMAQLLTLVKMRTLGTSAKTSYRSERFMNGDAINNFRKSINACSIKEGKVTCGDESQTLSHQRTICALGFAANKHNGYVEGDASFISDIANEDIAKLVETDTSLKSSRRLLQTIEPTVMIDVDDINNYPNITRIDTNMINLQLTVDLSKAGEGSEVKASNMIQLFSLATTVILAAITTF